MEFDEQEIKKGISVERKPNKYSVSQERVTLVSNASSEINRDGYSFRGWVRTNEDCSDTSKKDNRYNSVNPVYIVSDDEKGQNLYFVATWSKNHFQVKDIVLNVLDRESLIGVSTTYKYSAEKDEYAVDMKSTIKPEVELRLHTNVVSGKLEVEAKNAIVKDINDSTVKDFLISNHPDGDYLKIIPDNLGTYEVKLRSPSNSIYFTDSLVLKGEYTLPYKKLKFYDINLNENRAFDGTYTNDLSKEEYINFNTNLDVINFSIPTANISNTDMTGRTLKGYKNALFIEDTSDKHLIPADTCSVKMDVIGNPDSNGEVKLYPIYEAKNYNVTYTLGSKQVVFDENNEVFPNAFTADTPKSIGDKAGLDKYYKLVDGKYIPTEDLDLNTIYIKDTNVKTTIPQVSSPFSDINVNLTGSSSYAYKVYSGTDLMYNPENPMLLETHKEAISNTENPTKEGVYFLKDKDVIIIDPPVQNSVEYEEDNKNFVFSGIYESTTKTFIPKDEETGKYIYHITKTETSGLNFYAVWDFQELIEVFVNNDNNIESVIIE